MVETSETPATVDVFKPKLRKIDVLNSVAFHSSLLAAMEGKSRLVLDLSEVQFVDSSGLGKIIAGLRAFREKGGEMRICGVQAPVRVLFSMVRLGEIVGIDDDVTSAMAQLSRAKPGA
ncbi:MAG TPA: STAS domain-containing protein [Rectinemataceae bacterium]|nr:STAS domain-containing protein [Rectinemataceae bacterium]